MNKVIIVILLIIIVVLLIIIVALIILIIIIFNVEIIEQVVLFFMQLVKILRCMAISYVHIVWWIIGKLVDRKILQHLIAIELEWKVAQFLQLDVKVAKF